MRHIFQGIKVGAGWGLSIGGITFALVMPYAFNGVNNIPIPILLYTGMMMITGAILVK